MGTIFKHQTIKKFIRIGSILFLSAISLCGHENKKIHPYILTSKAFGLFDKPEYKKYYDEFEQFFEPTPANLDQLPAGPKKGTLGTIDEDGEGGWYNPSNTRPLNHFYNPKTGTGLPIPFTKTALEYGQILWEESKNQYNNGNKNIKRGRFWFRNEE